MTARLNDLYPGKTPSGTEVEIVGGSGSSIFIRIGKRTVKVSPKWIDQGPDPEQFQSRGLRVERSVMG